MFLHSLITYFVYVMPEFHLLLYSKQLNVLPQTICFITGSFLLVLAPSASPLFSVSINIPPVACPARGKSVIWHNSNFYVCNSLLDAYSPIASFTACSTLLLLFSSSQSICVVPQPWSMQNVCQLCTFVMITYLACKHYIDSILVSYNNFSIGINT